MKKTFLFLLMITLIPGFVFSANLKVGQTIPYFDLKGDNDDEIGRLKVKGDGIEYLDFSVAGLTGKVRSILYIAATMSASEINEAYTDALTAAKIPTDKYQTVILMNLDEALWGTGGIVKGKIEKKQKGIPTSMFVIDEDGDGLKKWGIKTDYAVIVIDQQGKVIAVKDDKLNSSDIKKFISLIRSKL